MYKPAIGLLIFLAIFSGVSSMSITDPVVSAIRGLESTLLMLSALALYVFDNKRGK